MKKNYVSVEVDVIFLASEDIITESADCIVYDPNNILDDKNNDVWEW